MLNTMSDTNADSATIWSGFAASRQSGEPVSPSRHPRVALGTKRISSQPAPTTSEVEALLVKSDDSNIESRGSSEVPRHRELSSIKNVSAAVPLASRWPDYEDAPEEDTLTYTKSSPDVPASMQVRRGGRRSQVSGRSRVSGPTTWSTRGSSGRGRGVLFDWTQPSTTFSYPTVQPESHQISVSSSDGRQHSSSRSRGRGVRYRSGRGRRGNRGNFPRGSSETEPARPPQDFQRGAGDSNRGSFVILQRPQGNVHNQVQSLRELGLGLGSEQSEVEGQNEAEEKERSDRE